MIKGKVIVHPHFAFPFMVDDDHLRPDLEASEFVKKPLKANEGLFYEISDFIKIPISELT